MTPMVQAGPVGIQAQFGTGPALLLLAGQEAVAGAAADA
jgi:hypothetical protein